MLLTILDTRMSGERTPHTAEPAHDGDPYGTWRVSWLPGRAVSRTQAVTALILAEAAAAMQHEGRTVVTDHTHRLWPHIDSWAAELDMTGPEAFARITDTEPS